MLQANDGEVSKLIDSEEFYQMMGCTYSNTFSYYLTIVIASSDISNRVDLVNYVG